MALPLATALGLLLVMAGGCNGPTGTVTLTPQERLELESRALDLLTRAARSEQDDVACNAIEALARVAPRDGLPIFRDAVRSPSPLVRYAGFAALGEVRDRASLPAMTAGINDVSPHVRLAAAFAACRCGKDGYARILVRTLTDTPEENLRADAATLLGRLGEPRAVKALRAALQSPANKNSKPVTLALHGALAALGQEASLRELITYSQGDTATRSVALLLLADLGKPEARDALRYRLLGVGEEYVEARLIAARGLGKLGYRDGYDLAMQMLTFTDPNPDPTPENPDRTYPVRSMAVHALAEIGDPRAIVALRQLAGAQDDPRLQVAACYAIYKIANR
jgi:HEAT repeat protein